MGKEGKYGTAEGPSDSEVMAQLKLMLKFKKFRGKKLRQLLSFLVSETVEGRGDKLTAEYIAKSLGEELSWEEDGARWIYKSTKSNLPHVRSRLREYFEGDGFADPLIFKLNPGSYAPVIAYNPNAYDPDGLDLNSQRVIVRVKAAIDARTMMGALRAAEHWSAMDINGTHPRLLANLNFIPFAIAPLMPYAAHKQMEVAADLIQMTKATRTEPWESIFAEACIAACHKHQWSSALELFEKAADRSQDEAACFWWYTALLCSLGKQNKGIDLLEASVAHFAWSNVAIRTDLAMLQIMDDRFLDAEELLNATLDFAPEENALIACTMGLLYEAQDRLKEAMDAVVKWIVDFTDKTSSILPFNFFHARRARVDVHVFSAGVFILIAGRAGSKFAAPFFDNILKRKEKYNKTSSVEIALGCIGLGRYDDAVAWLRRAAFEEDDPYSMWFHIFPPLRHLRGHSGYEALLRDLHLPKP